MLQVQETSLILYSRETEPLTSEMCVIPGWWGHCMARARLSREGEQQRMGVEKAMGILTQAVVVDSCELKVSPISILLILK